MNKATAKKLFTAIERGNSKLLAEILDEHAGAVEALGDHNAYVRDKTPLMFAIQCRNLRFANALLDRGANASAVMPAGPRNSVLQLCVDAAYYGDKPEHNGWVKLATRLLDLGAEPTSALYRALYGFNHGFVKRADLIRLLLSRGADPDAQLGDTGSTVREIVALNSRLYSNEVLGLLHVQPAANNKPKDAKLKRTPRPFMEHPCGDFKTPVDAMAAAIKKLRALPDWNKWITFCAQGMGSRVDSYHFASIRMRQGDIAFMVETKPNRWTEKKLKLDIKAVTKRARVPESCIAKTKAGYTVSNATPLQAARIVDSIFRQYMGIRPHRGEGNGYAICAEW